LDTHRTPRGRKPYACGAVLLGALCSECGTTVSSRDGEILPFMVAAIFPALLVLHAARVLDGAARRTHTQFYGSFSTGKRPCLARWQVRKNHENKNHWGCAVPTKPGSGGR
jgi:hypothetical protein